MTDCGCDLETSHSLERKTLRVLLAINAVMFVVEAIAGWLGDSTGLLADSLDMLADASVYGIALLAVGRSDVAKAHAARASGILQVALGVGVLADVLRRFLGSSQPLSALMLSVGTCALVANVACLHLLAKHRAGGVHMRASWIFSRNDVVANLGVIVAGALVWAWGTRLPDLAIGSLVALVVVRGGLQILREARAAGGAAAA